MDNDHSLPVGQRLKQQRERRGLSLEYVHETVKIPLDALRAIEEGYTIRTMSPFYYKGFIKIYGQFLDVDISDVLNAHQRDFTGRSLEQEERQFFIRDMLTNLFTTRRIQQVFMVVSALLMFLFLFHVVRWISGRPKKETPPSVATTVSDVEPSRPRVRVVVPPEPAAAPPERVRPTDTQSPDASSVTASGPPTDTGSGPAAAAERSSPYLSKEVVLVVRARKESWLRVRVDGMVVFQSTLPMGSVETWMSDEAIEISDKNIDQLEFELNGEMIGTLGRKDCQAKSIEITPDGLKVRK
jgi:cytoskeleton protein RodZ